MSSDLEPRKVGPDDDAHKVLLRTVGVSKTYEGVQALRDVSFSLRAGEVHALVGENGAGKSTLIKIITGAVLPDGGQLEIDGAEVRNNSPSLARSLGIAAIYQQPALFPDLTVAENIALGLERANAWTRVNWKKRNSRAVELLKQTAAHLDPDQTVGNLTMPEQQLVEIARALGANARVVIMDEPTASLAEAEVQNLYRVIKNLREQGAGIIYISHRLEELAVVADRVTVLRDGEVIETRPMRDLAVRELIGLMVGRELSAVFPKRTVETGEVVLELCGAGCRSNGVTDIDLTVRAGEIVGLAGLVGAGRTELARTIFGLDPADSGEIRIHGRNIKLNAPFDAIQNGIAYLPEDRRRHGVIPDMSVTSNLTLASLNKFSRNGAIDTQRETATAAAAVRRLGIKTRAIFSPVSTLSGGNQQKVALGRWLETRPSLLILDEPTQGIDVGAKAEIHSLMGELAEQGVAILMISSELPEILGMSDRIVVLRQGTIAGTLNRSEATQETIMSLALGHEAGHKEAQKAQK